MVTQIVENLVGNALKYTPAGSPIEIDVDATEDGWLLAVEDQGAGIPVEERDAVFEPFQRLGDHPSPGTGIGLSLVERFARAHGGWADVVDGRGGGARFRVHLRGPHLASRGNGSAQVVDVDDPASLAAQAAALS
jgi:two-component system OmpR family sensor kinase